VWVPSMKVAKHLRGSHRLALDAFARTAAGVWTISLDDLLETARLTPEHAAPYRRLQIPFRFIALRHIAAGYFIRFPDVSAAALAELPGQLPNPFALHSGSVAANSNEPGMSIFAAKLAKLITEATRCGLFHGEHPKRTTYSLACAIEGRLRQDFDHERSAAETAGVAAVHVEQFGGDPGHVVPSESATEPTGATPYRFAKARAQEVRHHSGVPSVDIPLSDVLRLSAEHWAYNLLKPERIPLAFRRAFGEAMYAKRGQAIGALYRGRSFTGLGIAEENRARSELDERYEDDRTARGGAITTSGSPWRTPGGPPGGRYIPVGKATNRLAPPPNTRNSHKAAGRRQVLCARPTCAPRIPT